MNANTLKALRGSIKKWERIATGHGKDGGSTNCPLCKEFLSQNSPCHGCPVMQRTGQASCRDTPYVNFYHIASAENDSLGDVYNTSQVAGPRAQQAAINEYKFLVSLLPPGEEP